MTFTRVAFRNDSHWSSCLDCSMDVYQSVVYQGRTDNPFRSARRSLTIPNKNKSKKQTTSTESLFDRLAAFVSRERQSYRRIPRRKRLQWSKRRLCVMKSDVRVCFRKSKSACSKTKKTMTKSDGDTAVGNQQAKPSSKTKKKPVDAPPPVQKLFQKSKTPKTPSPVAISIQPLSEDKPTNTVPSLSSEWPSTTISEPIEPKKGARAARGTTKRQLNRKQTSKRPAGKSRLVLQNVRKMIEDQSSHDPPLQHDRPKESAQLWKCLISSIVQQPSTIFRARNKSIVTVCEPTQQMSPVGDVEIVDRIK